MNEIETAATRELSPQSLVPGQTWNTIRWIDKFHHSPSTTPAMIRCGKRLV